MECKNGQHLYSGRAFSARTGLETVKSDYNVRHVFVCCSIPVPPDLYRHHDHDNHHHHQQQQRIIARWAKSHCKVGKPFSPRDFQVIIVIAIVMAGPILLDFQILIFYLQMKEMFIQLSDYFFT